MSQGVGFHEDKYSF